MAVNLSPVGGVAAQFFTNTGAVLTGGKLYTYAAGTTTPATAYTSSNGATAWTNPIVLDAAGRVSGSGEIWLTDGINYKFVLKDSNDVLIATYDNVSGINSNFISFTNQQQIVVATANQTVFNLSISYQVATNSLSVFVDGVNQYGPGAQYAYTETSSTSVTFTNGLHVGAVVKFTTAQQQGSGAVNASQVTYNPAGAGAVATNVQAKLRQSVSVMDFGAIGNGVANDTAAIQAAIASGAQEILFPEGTYLTSPILIDNRNFLTFRGLGNPTIMFTGGSYGFRLGNPTHATFARIIRFESLVISTNAALAVALDMQSAIDCSFKNIRIQDPSNLITLGLYLEWSWDNTFYDLVVKALNGLEFNDQANKNSIYGGRFESTDSTVGTGILSSFGTANICSGIDVSSWKYGYKIEGCAGFVIQGNYFEANTTNDIFIQGSASGIVIEGNFFDDRTTPITSIAAGSVGASGVSIKGNSIYKHSGGTGVGISLNATCFNWNIAANLFLNSGSNYVGASLASSTFIDGEFCSDGVNVGIGEMPQVGWGADYKAIDFTGGGAISSYQLGSEQLNLSWNAYATDATTWKYTKTGDVASRFGIDNQVFRWYSAGAGTAGATIPFVVKMILDTNGNLIQTVNSTAPTLTDNKTLAFELTSDTQLKIKVRGSDGVTRSTTLTLS